MKNVYGYIRVSNKKQEDGASLIEQKRIISEYAKTNNLKIIHFYEETKTAAKRGRPFFEEMLKNLKERKAEGVIMHKIDRSARNLHDWANIGDLIDNNIAVFFAHESLNLNERGGRLSADIQAVMASDYVRNLRQETIKGIYGRLKQGFYPFAAPVGYLNNGKGKLKTICPKQGQLVKELFELYTTKKYNIISLSSEMEKRGLQNQKGNRVCKNGISRILNNEFYIGIINVKGQSFEGKHKPLIDTKIFKRAQLILKGRQNVRGIKHEFLYRGMLKCEHCKYTMPGETQKGNVYYRCHTKNCLTKSIREDTVEHYVKNVLSTINLNPSEINNIRAEKNKILSDRKVRILKEEQGLNLQISKIDKTEEKLLDFYLENLIDKEEYEKRKKKLLVEKCDIKQKKDSFTKSGEQIFNQIEKFLELCKQPYIFYKNAILEEKREYLKKLTSNLTVSGRSVMFSMLSPFQELANRDFLVSGVDSRDKPLTKTLQIIYTDKNTSGIQPKPLTKEQTGHFFNILLSNNSILDDSNPTENHEV
jgi:DNA invertase Pin-like site-specific DNA recombinase